MLFVFFMLSALSVSSANPHNNFNGRNVITVPPNCPPGQEWINGQCRDIWLKFTTPVPAFRTSADNLNGRNMITAPHNCRDGQQWINGQCRDIWFKLTDLASPLYTKDKDGDISPVNIVNEPNIEGSWRNIISVPNQCPEGYKPDALGICRRIF